MPQWDQYPRSVASRSQVLTNATWSGINHLMPNDYPTLHLRLERHFRQAQERDNMAVKVSTMGSYWSGS